MEVEESGGGEVEQSWSCGGDGVAIAILVCQQRQTRRHKDKVEVEWKWKKKKKEKKNSKDKRQKERGFESGSCLGSQSNQADPRRLRCVGSASPGTPNNIASVVAVGILHAVRCCGSTAAGSRTRGRGRGSRAAYAD